MKTISLIEAALAKALRRAPTDPDLLALKGSLGDTLEPELVLRYLKDWYATGKVLQNLPS